VLRCSSNDCFSYSCAFLVFFFADCFLIDTIASVPSAQSDAFVLSHYGFLGLCVWTGRRTEVRTSRL
jgi:hypothetical protein